MGRYNEATLLAQFEHDSVTNSLQVPDSLAFPPTSGTGYPITTVAAYSGPTAIQITDILVSFGDIVVTDPASDLFLGWALWTASDFGASPTYASLLGYTANADLPHIHDNSESTTAIQAVVNAPVSLLNYIGAGGNLVYATQALQPAGRKLPATSLRIPGNRLFQVRLGTYMDGTLTAVTGLDNVTVFVYGYRVGAPS